MPLLTMPPRCTTRPLSPPARIDLLVTDTSSPSHAENPPSHSGLLSPSRVMSTLKLKAVKTVIRLPRQRGHIRQPEAVVAGLHEPDDDELQRVRRRELQLDDDLARVRSRAAG